MSENINTTGKCLCGAVSIKASELSTHVGSCHCSMCRNWTGGPFLAVEAKGGVEISGEDSVARYSSSEWGERGFCKKCGTSLFYRLKPTNQYILSAGLFAEIKDFVFDHQIFIDEKPTYYSFANETKNMTGAEVFAQYSANDE